MTTIRLENRSTGILVLIAVAAIVLCACYAVALMVFLGDWNSRGLFGDMFGGLNAVFSGLALAGVLVAILLQSEELKQQRQELRETRDELQRTASAQEMLTKLEALSAVSRTYSEILIPIAGTQKLHQMSGGFDEMASKLLVALDELEKGLSASGISLLRR